MFTHNGEGEGRACVLCFVRFSTVHASQPRMKLRALPLACATNVLATASRTASATHARKRARRLLMQVYGYPTSRPALSTSPLRRLWTHALDSVLLVQVPVRRAVRPYAITWSRLCLPAASP